MNWFVLIIAGLCECGFTYCLAKSKDAVGVSFSLWITGFIIFSVASMYLLMHAAKSIPVGTAYPVWTGIGAAGTVLLGIFIFHEPVTFWRLFFITTLVISVIGLKLV